ncbi:hypothetical protein SBY92_000177 [Candida maltosa Xu316]
MNSNNSDSPKSTSTTLPLDSPRPKRTHSKSSIITHRFKKHTSPSPEVVTRAQIRRSSTVPSGIAMKNHLNNNNNSPRTSFSLPNSPELKEKLDDSEEFIPSAPTRNFSTGSGSNYQLSTNSSGNNLMGLTDGYLTLDLSMNDESASVFTGNRLIEEDEDEDDDDNNSDDSSDNLWALPIADYKPNIPRAYSTTSKKNVRFI